MQPARLSPNRVESTYSWIAPAHDLFARLLESRARNLAHQWAAVQDGERILEVGVGTGLSFLRLLRANSTGWTEGLDRTPAMLRRARHRAAQSSTTQWRLRRGDARALPYDDADFQLLFNSYMLDLLPKPEFQPVLREFHRVLVPGGRLVMISMTPGPHWYHKVWELLYTLYPPLLGGCRGVRLAPAVREAGFVNVRRAFVSQWTFPSEVLFAQKPT